MKKCSFLVIPILILNSVTLFSEVIRINENKLNVDKAGLKLYENSHNGFSLNLTISEISSFDVLTDKGEFSQIKVDGFSYSNRIGEPKLPVLRKIFSVPCDAEIEVQAQESIITEYLLSDFNINHQIIPTQNPVSKSTDSSTIAFEYDESTYKINNYLLVPLASVNELGSSRGMRLFSITIEPIQYNPIKKSIQVYNDINISVTFKNSDFPKTEYLRRKNYSIHFEVAYAKSVINYQPFESRDEIINYPIRYIVISDPMFQNQLQPFINWKIQSGYDIIEAYTDNPLVGTTKISIKNYIQNIYNTSTPSDPTPSYILFVGDIAQIPAWDGSTDTHITDLDYSKLDGPDMIPDMYYGRFSANNTSELQPQIDKTLEYEKHEMPNPDYLSEVVLIAGMDSYYASTWGNGQINYGTSNYFNLAHGITSHTYLYPDSGNNSTQIIQNVNDGVGFINYTAHGNSTGWSDPSFLINDVNNLSNIHEYVFGIGNCCLTNKFDETTCFGEALLRVADKGAIGYIGATNSTTWDEDFWWGVGAGTVSSHPTYAGTGYGAYDGIFHDNGEDFSDWFTTAGSIIYCGNLAVTEGGGNIDYYWEIYSFMGDPSLEPYLGIPQVNISSYPSSLQVGDTQMIVTAEPYSYVAISKENQILASELIGVSGSISLQFDPISSSGSASLVITKQNHIPEIATIPVSHLGTWTGVVSSSWHNSNNWFGGSIPDISIDVYIPSSTPNSPTISIINAGCKNLEIGSDADLTIHGRTLEVQEDVSIYGELVMDDNDSELRVYDDLYWKDGSTADISAPGAIINVYSTFQFFSTSNAELENGTVNLLGPTYSTITSGNTSCALNNLSLNKSGATVFLGNEFSAKLKVLGNLSIGSSTFVTNSHENNDLILMGNITSLGTLQMDHATIEFEGDIQSIELSSGDYFNNIVINSSSYIQLLSDINLHANLELDTGNLAAVYYDISIDGDWIMNQSYPNSFSAGTGAVNFIGSSDQTCNGSSFNTFNINKPSSSHLIIPTGAYVQCNSYNWTQGILEVDGGQFVAHDLYDSSIVGPYLLNSGQIDLYQDSNNRIDVGGSIVIYDGVFNIHGGVDDCWFAHYGPAYLFMDGGVLDVKDHGIHFDDAYTFSHVITGGIIKMTGNFTSDKHDFDPANNEIVLYGSDDAQIYFGWGNSFHDITIDKQVSRDDTKQNPYLHVEKNKSNRNNESYQDNTRSGAFYIYGNLDLSGDLEILNGNVYMTGNTVEVENDVIISGSLEMINPADHLNVGGSVIWNSGSSENITNGEISVEEDWQFLNGTTATLGADNTVRFDGSSSSEITISEADDASFGNVIMDKSSSYTSQSTFYSAYLKITGDLTMNTNDTFNAYNVSLDGEFFMDTGTELFMSSGNFDVLSDVECNGDLHLEGGNFTASQNFLLTSSGTMDIDGGNVILNKPVTGNFMSFAGTLNLQAGSLEITNEGIQFGTGATPLMVDGTTIRVGGSFYAIQSNAFQPTGGTIELIGTGSPSINCSNGNYFHNLTINKSGVTSACQVANDLSVINNLNIYDGSIISTGHDITINNNLLIDTNGQLNPGSQLLQVGGDWTNNRGAIGFIEGTGTVSFIGGNSYLMTNENFYNLEVNKTGNEFTYLILNNDVVINVANDVNINSCSMRLYDNSTLNIDHDLFISENTNLYANNTAPTAINVSSTWYNNNTTGYPWGYGFVPGQSTVTFDGIDDSFIENDYGTEEFHNLNIDKTAGWFMPYAHVKVQNNCEIIQGSWNKDTSGLQFSFYGDLTIQAAGSWDDDVNSVYFVGDEDQWLKNYGTGGTNFQHLYINQQTGSRTDPVVALNNNISCYTLYVLEGGLFMNGQTVECEHRIKAEAGGKIVGYSISTIAMEDNSELLIDGGELQLIGDGINNPLVTHTSGHYEIIVKNGGVLAADNVTFEYMASNGIYFFNGGLIDETNSMNNCTFQNGENNGTLIRIDNTQDLTISNAHFPTNTWGGNYNVYKGLSTGIVEFDGATGDFAGEDYDYDPNNNVNWIAGPEIIVLPAVTIDFGEIIIGESEMSSITIENTGGSTLEGTITTPDGYSVVEYLGRDNTEEYSRNTLPYSVETGITKIFIVYFTPLLEQIYSGDVVITHNAAGPDETVHVVGEGITPPPPEIYVDPTLLVFGDLLVGLQDTLVFYIENTGESMLSGTITTPDGYSVDEWYGYRNNSQDSRLQTISNPDSRNIFPFDIGDGDFMEYQVVFEPTAVQSYNGNIVISHNAGADEIITLEGDGIGAELTTDPSSFEKLLTADDTTSDILSIGNNGNLDLSYSASIDYIPFTRDVLIESGFEDDVPPAGWTEEIIIGWMGWGPDSHSHTGSSCAYINPMYETSAKLITPFFVATDDCTLNYWIRAYVPTATVVNSEFWIEVSTDGVNWTTIDSYSQSLLTETYALKTLSLAAYAAQNIQVSFRVNDNMNERGVCLDDVEITGTYPTYTWLTLDGGTSASGTIPVSSPDDDIDVGFDSSGLEDGTYNADIVISSNDPIYPDFNIPVTLTVGAPSTPTVTTNAITDIDQTSATGGGNVTADGGSSVTARGVCWSILSNPTTADDNTTDGSGIGVFVSSLTGFDPDTHYYVRAYATNAAGTSYGAEQEFDTLPDAPPDPPANLIIEIIGTNAVLNWDTVTGADSYKVYSSDDPYEAYMDWDFKEEVILTTWSEPVPETKRFYYVTTVKEAVRSEEVKSK